MNIRFSHQIYAVVLVVKTCYVWSVKRFVVLRAGMFLRNLVLMISYRAHQYSAGPRELRPESKKCLPRVAGISSAGVFLSQLTD